MMSDQELRAALRRLAPDVEEAGVWDALHRRDARERILSTPAGSAEKVSTGNARLTRSRGIHGIKRVAGLAAVAVIVLVALGLGISALVEHLGQERSVVVIGDDSMSPGATGPAGGAAAGVGEVARKYGEIVRFAGLEMAVTVAPQPVPLDTPSEPDPPAGAGKRVRSQLILTNTGDEDYGFVAADIQLVDATGGRHSPVGTESRQPMVVEAGGTLTVALDWYLPADVEVACVAYAPTEGSGESFRWGPEAITAGPGYPVLTSLPPLRVEDVESFEYEGWDEQGRPLPVQTVTAAENPSGIAALVELYGQTTLDPAEGYPNYTTPVHLKLHLKNGTDFSIWIQAAGSGTCIIQDTRATSDGNPPAATGKNAALVRAFYGLEGAYGEGGWSVTPFVGASETVTTFGQAVTTGSPSVSASTSTTPATWPRLTWGDTAVLEGRKITVERPLEEPEASASRDTRVVYSMVTISNTGREPLAYVASEFFLEGNSSGSTGIAGQPGTVGGQPVLTRGTLAPGESVRGAVRFNLKREDVPVKIRLGTPTSTAVTLAAWQ